MSKNDDYTTENLLNFSYHQNYYKLLGTNLSRKTNKNIPQQNYFTGKLEEDDGAKMFFIAKKQQRKNYKFLFGFINCNRVI